MKQISVKLTDYEAAMLDELVCRGELQNRSHGISEGLILLAEQHRMKRDKLSELRYQRPGRRRVKRARPDHLKVADIPEQH